MEKCSDCRHLNGQRCGAPLPEWLGQLLDSIRVGLDNTVASDVMTSCPVFALSAAAKCAGCGGSGKQYVGTNGPALFELNGWPCEAVECWNCDGTGRRQT